MDILGRESLEKMLSKYEGTILFVSHDRYFTEKIATSLIVFDECGCNYYKNTSYSEYEKIRKERLDSATDVTSEQKPKEKKQEKLKQNTYLQNKEKARNIAKQKRIENQISILEQEIEKLNNDLASEDVYSDYTKVLDLQKQIQEKSEQVDILTAEWLELEIK